MCYVIKRREDAVCFGSCLKFFSLRKWIGARKNSKQKTTSNWFRGYFFILMCVFLFQPTFPVGPTIGTNTAISFAPYLTPVTPGVGLVPTEILPTPPVIVPGSPPVSVPSSTATQKLLRTDKLEVLWTPLWLEIHSLLGCVRDPGGYDCCFRSEA